MDALNEHAMAVGIFSILIGTVRWVHLLRAAITSKDLLGSFLFYYACFSQKKPMIPKIGFLNAHKMCFQVNAVSKLTALTRRQLYFIYN